MTSEFYLVVINVCLVGSFVLAVVVGRLLNEKQDYQKPKTNADRIRNMSDEELV